jgi:hypothetical protein
MIFGLLQQVRTLAGLDLDLVVFEVELELVAGH